jgi:hypothetical protein
MKQLSCGYNHAHAAWACLFLLPRLRLTEVRPTVIVTVTGPRLAEVHPTNVD